MFSRCARSNNDCEVVPFPQVGMGGYTLQLSTGMLELSVEQWPRVAGYFAVYKGLYYPGFVGIIICHYEYILKIPINQAIYVSGVGAEHMYI